MHFFRGKGRKWVGKGREMGRKCEREKRGKIGSWFGSSSGKVGKLEKNEIIFWGIFVGRFFVDFFWGGGLLQKCAGGVVEVVGCMDINDRNER